MKKIKNIMLLMVIGLCSFLMVGEVKAEGTASNFEIVCDATEIQRGDTTTCHLIAKVTGGNIWGVAAKTTMDKLTLNAVNGSSGLSVIDDSLSAEYLTVGGKHSATSYTCQIEGSSTGSSFCALFLSRTDTPSIGGQNYTPKNSSAGNNENTTYTEIGIYNVKLAEDATDDNCGEICASVQFADTKATFTSGELSSDGNTKICEEIHPGLSGELNVKETPEETPEEPAETGSFASYSVLIAGAFIAISVIAIAKKHNKFYKI